MDCAKNYKNNFIYKNSLITILYKQKKRENSKEYKFIIHKTCHKKKNDCKNKKRFQINK